MTRFIVYVSSLLVSVAAAALTLTAILLPKWVSYSSNSVVGPIHMSYGLHQRCTSPDSCQPFPQKSDCMEDRYFCSMWRSVGFLMAFAMVMAGVVIAAYVVILAGGREKRENGWKILSTLLVIQALAQCVAMSLVSYLFDNDERFFVGWKLDLSFIFTTVSWTVSLVVAALIPLSAVFLPSEGGYDFLRD